MILWKLLPPSTIDTNDSLEALAPQITKSILTGIADTTILDSRAVKLEDGQPGWTIIATGTLSSVKLKMNITMALKGTRFFALLAMTPAATYDSFAGDINNMVASLHVGIPQLYGIPREQALILSGGESTNPRMYDPATTNGSGNKLVYSGLVSFDSQLKLTPELAESWQITDGITYTFNLRRNARFQNGRPVTAQDFVYAWERAANPKTKSDTVLTYLGDIVGVKEMKDGKTDHIAGIKALNDHMLQVAIDAPKPYFLLKLTYPTTFVVDRENVESGSEWYRTPNGTGPYRLIRWDRFKQMLYERNDDYYLKPPAIPYVIVNLFSGVGLRLYEAGDIDITGLSSVDVPRAQEPTGPLYKELLSSTSMCTTYITFDVKQPPFDDKKVRQAFTLAFDQQKYLDLVLHGIGLPAKGLYPPGLPGYNSTLKPQSYDPGLARKLMAESKYAGAMPPIVYTTSGTGSDTGRGVAAQVQMWQQTLGVNITVENLPSDQYTDEINAGHHGQIISGGWCADYPDPENFADVLFHTGADHNRGNYSNTEVDTLLERARIEPDVSKRIDMYQQAERIIVDDAAALFISHSQSYLLVKPYVKGYVMTPIDIELMRYLRIDSNKLK
ncbi:MAG: peptide ABC transporter substrate-binding protein [Chloroflexi bacterium]|nr:peptide ABC transporter substrate-binding protein [Chloroflexota bacterium]